MGLKGQEGLSLWVTYWACQASSFSCNTEPLFSRGRTDTVPSENAGDEVHYKTHLWFVLYEVPCGKSWHRFILLKGFWRNFHAILACSSAVRNMENKSFIPIMQKVTFSHIKHIHWLDRFSQCPQWVDAWFTARADSNPLRKSLYLFLSHVLDIHLLDEIFPCVDISFLRGQVC